MDTIQISEDLFTQCERAVISFVSKNRGASFIEIKNVLSKIIDTRPKPNIRDTKCNKD
jgi:hypothetical protein